MNFQTVVNDIKTRVDALTAQGQEVAKVLPDALKKANVIVVHNLETLVKTETEGAKELLASAKAGFDKARVDGLKAVVASPIEYLPEKDKFIDVFNETVDIFSKTGDQLYKTFKSTLAPPKKTVKVKAKTVKKAVKKTVAPRVKKAVAATKKAASDIASEASSSAS